MVGAFGNGRPEKGFHLLVEAAPAILRECPEACFVLVGGGVAHLSPRIEALGLRNRFVPPGHREDLLSVMALFDVFVFPRIDMDSCANVLLEAMALGLPVVGFGMPGMTEVIDEERGCGRLGRAGDPVALARGMASVLAAPEAARAMGRRARAAVEERHAVAGRVRETLEVYRSVLGGRGPQ